MHRLTATPVERALAWLNNAPSDESVLAANDQQLQSFTTDLEYVLGVVKPEVREMVQRKFGLHPHFGVLTSQDISTFRRRLGLLQQLARHVTLKAPRENSHDALSLDELLS